MTDDPNHVTSNRLLTLTKPLVIDRRNWLFNISNKLLTCFSLVKILCSVAGKTTAIKRLTIIWFILPCHYIILTNYSVRQAYQGIRKL